MANDLLSQISSEQLRKVLAIREEIENLENELESLLEGGSTSAAPAQAPAKRKYTRRKGAKKKAASSDSDSEATTKTGKKKRTFSAASRAKMAEAMRRRWAVKKGKKKAATKKTATKKAASKKATSKKTGAKKKRTFSAASRAKMAEAMRRRWAVKKGKKK